MSDERRERISALLEKNRLKIIQAFSIIMIVVFAFLGLYLITASLSVFLNDNPIIKAIDQIMHFIFTYILPITGWAFAEFIRRHSVNIKTDELRPCTWRELLSFAFRRP